MVSLFAKSAQGTERVVACADAVNSELSENLRKLSGEQSQITLHSVPYAPAGLFAKRLLKSQCLIKVVHTQNKRLSSMPDNLHRLFWPFEKKFIDAGKEQLQGLQ
jgi:hypothetical protein